MRSTKRRGSFSTRRERRRAERARRKRPLRVTRSWFPRLISLAAIAVGSIWFLGWHLFRPGLITAPRACEVESVHDGDTIRVLCGSERSTVRLYCIDAPELSQRPWGQEAKSWLAGHIGQQVLLVADTRDTYGRLVAEVMSTGNSGERQNINLGLVRSGRAPVYPRYCTEKAYYDAQREARAAALGIWGMPGAHQRPWEYRHRATRATMGNRPPLVATPAPMRGALSDALRVEDFAQ